MKISEITNRIKLSTAVSAAAMLTLVACSDKWDDHYGDAAASGNQSGETLWAAIEKSGNLKNFAAVLQDMTEFSTATSRSPSSHP